MTKEALEKEAKEYADWFWGASPSMMKALANAYIKGAELREKRIAELKAEVKEWKDKADLWCKTANLKDHNIMINKELEKENADLKCECRRCVYNDCPCILSDYGKDRNGICDHFKDVFDENAELKEINTHTLSQLNLDNGELIIELTKAKEIIKELLNSCFGYNSKTVNYEVKAKAEQFLKEE